MFRVGDKDRFLCIVICVMGSSVYLIKLLCLTTSRVSPYTSVVL